VKAAGGSVALLEQAGRRARCPFCAGREAETPAAVATVLDAKGNWRVRVVPNKFPAVMLSGADAKPQAAVGVHEVVVESPEHLTDVVQLDAAHFSSVLGVYRDRLRHWADDGRMRSGIVFKNSGYAAGASLEHLHSQLAALPYVPDSLQAELAGAEQFHAGRGRCIYCDLIQRELADGARIVIREDGYIAVAAYAGRQPYETWILPERHAARFDAAAEEDLLGLAQVFQRVLVRLHALADQLAYNVVLHTSPFDDSHAESYHWHWELIPRSTNLAGLELGAGVFINPLSPERAARRLREALH
jgi:UDPglucose--hexose-1-phosphate uridylyltransferase